MFKNLIKNYNKKKLKDKQFEFLFEDNLSNEIVVFDCETTGLNPKIDDIISIGAVKIKDNKILLNDSFHIFVKQKKDINHKSITIHQIRNCDLDGAIDIEEAIKKFLYYIGNRDLVGYYLEFDIAMINKYTKSQIGINLPNRQKEVSAIYYDKRVSYIPQGYIDLKFETILSTLNLPKLNAHNAMNDALMTAMMYIKLNQIKKIV